MAIGLIALVLGGYLTPLTRIVLNPVVSTQTWILTRSQILQYYLTSPQDLVQLRQRNLELEAEISRLQSEIIELKQQISETHILSALVDFARVHPDLTGWWQVMGQKNLSFEERIQLNLYYMFNLSLWLDLFIMIKSFWVVLIDRNG
jgi:hypothetical protein